MITATNYLIFVKHFSAKRIFFVLLLNDLLEDIKRLCEKNGIEESIIIPKL